MARINTSGASCVLLKKLTTWPRAWTPDGVLAGYPADGPPIALDPPGATVKSYGLPPVLRPISWSPDRTEVAGRMRGNAFGQSSLFIFTPATQDYWEVSHNAANASTMWLGNGQQLVFSRSEGIYVADVGTHQVKVALPIARRRLQLRPSASISPIPKPPLAVARLARE